MEFASGVNYLVYRIASRKYQSIFGHHVVLKARLYRVVLISSNNVYQSEGKNIDMLSYLLLKYLHISLVIYYYSLISLCKHFVPVKLVTTILHALHSYLGCISISSKTEIDFR